jgi:polysaccharide biosynthesis protein PslH
MTPPHQQVSGSPLAHNLSECEGISAPTSPAGHMRILWLSPYFPVPLSGAGTRVYQLLTALAKSSEIDLIAVAPSLDLPDDLKRSVAAACRSVTLVPAVVHSRRHKRFLQLRSVVGRRPAQYWMFFSREMQAHIDRALTTHSYDVVVLEHSFMGYYALPRHIPTVLDQHNVESEILLRSAEREGSLLRRTYNRLEYRRFISDERRICREVDLIQAASGRDRDAMLAWGAMPPSTVIANGVDTDFFRCREDTSDPERPVVVFTGTMSYLPNIQAILYFTDQIWPAIVQRVPNARLEVVGQSPPPDVLALARDPRIEVTGFVPDVRPYLSNAGAVIAPLLIGGGTRLKILEAMSMERPIVSTSLGCEGIDVQDGRHLLIADEPGAFADRLVDVLNDPQRYRMLGHAGRQLVEESYDWQSLGRQMDDAIRALVHSGQSNGGRRPAQTVRR